MLRLVLPEMGWTGEAVGWVWPLVGGHHGVIPAVRQVKQPPDRRGAVHGSPAWAAAQRNLVHRIAVETGVDLASVAAASTPRRAVQLALSGAVIMADWIASSDKHFPGVPDFKNVSMAGARGRAARAWDDLRLRGGWDPTALTLFPDQIRARFGKRARPVQADAVALAGAMAAPGLLLIEAAMGEGKTEAALAVVEVLARRFGADGVFVGMPTQATSDPMFSRVRAWAGQIEAGIPVGLLHGKRRFNPEWKRLENVVSVSGVDEFGCVDEYGVGPDKREVDRPIPAEWLLGPKRGLLSAVTVGTVDHILYAATRTRHVMLRHAGLAGRVVVLDEIHAYDAYMSQFLFEALRWLADAGVPVVLLSATLPPEARRRMVTAYLQGATQKREIDLTGLPEPVGYPHALSVCTVDGAPHFTATVSEPWRPSRAVDVRILPEEPTDGPDAVVRSLREALSAGGCALVVRNTVGRAQETYAAVKAAFDGDDVVLLHARLTAHQRADRTQRLLRQLGAPDQGDALPRPHRFVLVATQLAEQSFDIDADLLITDLAPIDLLLQRSGRLHRHDRPESQRPAAVRSPRVIVTGMSSPLDGPPRFPAGCVAVYGEHLLVRAAALVGAAAEAGWSVPADVPRLVAEGYDEAARLPSGWLERATAAHDQWRENQAKREANAEQFLLSTLDDLGKETLAGLHTRSVAEADDHAVGAAVRDGTESVEVVLVLRAEGGYRSLAGHWLGRAGEVAVSDEEILEEVVGCSIRLPSYPAVTAEAKQLLRPLPGWGLDPWLARTPALVLDEDCSTELGGFRLRYDEERGLVASRLIVRNQ